MAVITRWKMLSWNCHILLLVKILISLIVNIVKLSYLYMGVGPSRCYLTVISMMELSFTDRNLKMREKTQRFFWTIWFSFAQTCWQTILRSPIYLGGINQHQHAKGLGNLFVSLGLTQGGLGLGFNKSLTARVTRVERAEVFQPLGWIIFACNWKL